jgi:glycerol-3-phosphate acyltransferase PlsY
MNYFISAIIGYLIGSFPSAYVFLKKGKGIDITKSGSGNVGALNSFEVTRSKIIGISVLIVDALKGILAVLFTKNFIQSEFIYPMLALIFAVMSHCYNPWIKFKGGRGLATAAGGALIISPFILALWAILWFLFFMLKRDVHFGNIFATLFSVVILWLTSGIAIKYTFPKAKNELELAITGTAILLIVFSKHINPLIEIIRKNFFNRSENEKQI